uniref:Major facilitator superfamily (MFS) profile domain-containing protein n=1 Tax=Panagrolaimus davidi TaxID=227884 RepID=A0A914PLK7_9BILA
MISFYLLTYSWPFISGEVTYKDPSKNSTEGCNTEKFDWCEDLSQVNLWLYYILFVGVVGIGFSTMNVALITLYSEILGPRRQGTLQGIFQISSASSRMLGPFVLGNLYDAYGPKMTWKIELGMLSIAGAAWIAFYRKMVPLKTDKDGDDTELKDRSIKSKKEGNNNGVTNEAFDKTD